MKRHREQFGNKSSFAYTRQSGIIVGAMAIEGNAYDGHTLKPQLDQVKKLTKGKTSKAIVDRGFKGQDKIEETEVVMPNARKRESYFMKKQREVRCRSRAGIEGLISHLKHDHKMLKNYLKGAAGVQINTLMAAAAYNMIKWMRLKQQELIFFLFRAYYRMILFHLENIQSIRG